MKNITINMRRRIANPLVPIFKIDMGIDATSSISQRVSPYVSPNVDPVKKITSNSSIGANGLFPEVKMNKINNISVNIMDEIIPNLWLGEIIPESDIINNHFTHVLSIYDKPPSFINSKKFITKWINIKDNGSENILDYFDECCEFIHTALLSGGKIYVHCQFGISRSPTIIIAYIMRYGICCEKEEKFHFIDALEYVGSKRPIICPNFGFNISLRNYEKILFD
jgi:protein-tyrosine phosphatase